MKQYTTVTAGRLLTFARPRSTKGGCCCVAELLIAAGRKRAEAEAVLISEAQILSRDCLLPPHAFVQMSRCCTAPMLAASAPPPRDAARRRCGWLDKALISSRPLLSSSLHSASHIAAALLYGLSSEPAVSSIRLRQCTSDSFHSQCPPRPSIKCRSDPMARSGTQCLSPLQSKPSRSSSLSLPASTASAACSSGTVRLAHPHRGHHSFASPCRAGDSTN